MKKVPQTAAPTAPSDFERCIFEVVPRLKYDMQVNLDDLLSNYGRDRDSIGIYEDGDPLVERQVKALVQQVESETKENTAEYRRTVGKDVVYGHIVQLRHIKSKSYLSLTVKEAAEIEKDAMRIVLEKEGSEGSWFIIAPRLKMRSEGEAVNLGDQVAFISRKFNNFLFCSMKLSRTEVCGSPLASPWRVIPFAPFVPQASTRCLKAGDVIRIFHKEIDGFLTNEVSMPTTEANRGAVTASSKLFFESHISMNASNRHDAVLASQSSNSNSLWMVELENIMRGGIVSFEHSVRFKHIPSGKYLACEFLHEEAEATLSEMIDSAQAATSSTSIFQTPQASTMLSSNAQSQLGRLAAPTHSTSTTLARAPHSGQLTRNPSAPLTTPSSAASSSLPSINATGKLNIFMADDPNTPSALFTFHSANNPNQSEGQVELDSFLRIRHKLTKCWLHAAVEDENASKKRKGKHYGRGTEGNYRHHRHHHTGPSDPLRSSTPATASAAATAATTVERTFADVEARTAFFDSDVYVLAPVASSDVHALYQVLGEIHYLQSYLGTLTRAAQHNFYRNDRRSATWLANDTRRLARVLGALIDGCKSSNSPRVSNSSSHGSNDSQSSSKQSNDSTSNSLPNTKMQNLLREQNIADVLVAILSRVFKNIKSEEELDEFREDPDHFALINACKLSYSLLRHLVIENDENRAYLSKYVPFMMGQVGHSIKAASTLMELFKDNYELATGITEQTLQTVFISKLHVQPVMRYVQFLSVLCACRGAPLTKNQDFITKSLISDNPDVFLPIKEIKTVNEADSTSTTQIYMRIPVKDTFRWVSLDELVSTINPGFKAMAYLVESVELLAQLCKGGNIHTVSIIARHITPSMTAKCLETEALPPALRAVLCRLHLNLMLADKEIAKPVAFLNHTRLWSDINKEYWRQNSTDPEVRESTNAVSSSSSPLHHSVAPSPMAPATNTGPRLRKGARIALPQGKDSKGNASGLNASNSSDNASSSTSKPTNTPAGAAGKSTLSPSSNFRVSLDDVKQTKAFIMNYLQQTSNSSYGPGSEVNRLTAAVVEMTRHFFSFGRFSHEEIVQLIPILLQLCRSHTFPTSYSYSKPDEKVQMNINPYERTPLTKHIANFKFSICQILDMACDYRTDCRLTQLLVLYKKQIEASNSTSETASGPNAMPGNLASLSGIFEQVATALRNTVEEEAIPGLESIFNLMALDSQLYVPVISDCVLYQQSALATLGSRLLVRHYSQKQELMDALQTVQILVDPELVVTYQTVTRSLTALKRAITAGTTSEGGDNQKLQDSAVQILENLIALVACPGDTSTATDLETPESYGEKNATEPTTAQLARLHEHQRLMINLRVDDTILELMQVDLTKLNFNLTTLCYRLLKSLCYGPFPDGQASLFKHIDFFLSHIDDDEVSLYAAQIIQAIFEGNRSIAALITDVQLRKILTQVARKKLPVFLDILHSAVLFDGKPFRRNQNMIAKLLVEKQHDVVVLYSDTSSLRRRNEMIKALQFRIPNSELLYHLKLLDLFVISCKGRVYEAEAKCQSLFSLDDILFQIGDRQNWPRIKSSFLALLEEAYLVTERSLKNIAQAPQIWELMQIFIRDIRGLISHDFTPKTPGLKDKYQLSDYYTSSTKSIDHKVRLSRSEEVPKNLPQTSEPASPVGPSPPHSQQVTPLLANRRGHLVVNASTLAAATAKVPKDSAESGALETVNELGQPKQAASSAIPRLVRRDHHRGATGSDEMDPPVSPSSVATRTSLSSPVLNLPSARVSKSASDIPTDESHPITEDSQIKQQEPVETPEESIVDASRVDSDKEESDSDSDRDSESESVDSEEEERRSKARLAAARARDAAIIAESLGQEIPKEYQDQEDTESESSESSDTESIDSEEEERRTKARLQAARERDAALISETLAKAQLKQDEVDKMVSEEEGKAGDEKGEESEASTKSKASSSASKERDSILIAEAQGEAEIVSKQIDEDKISADPREKEDEENGDADDETSSSSSDSSSTSVDSEEEERRTAERLAAARARDAALMEQGDSNTNNSSAQPAPEAEIDENAPLRKRLFYESERTFIFESVLPFLGHFCVGQWATKRFDANQSEKLSDVLDEVFSLTNIANLTPSQSSAIAHCIQSLMLRGIQGTQHQTEISSWLSAHNSKSSNTRTQSATNTSGPSSSSENSIEPLIAEEASIDPLKQAQQAVELGSASLLADSILSSSVAPKSRLSAAQNATVIGKESIKLKTDSSLQSSSVSPSKTPLLRTMSYIDTSLETVSSEVITNGIRLFHRDCCEALCPDQELIGLALFFKRDLSRSFPKAEKDDITSLDNECDSRTGLSTSSSQIGDVSSPQMRRAGLASPRPARSSRLSSSAQSPLSSPLGIPRKSSFQKTLANMPSITRKLVNQLCDPSFAPHLSSESATIVYILRALRILLMEPRVQSHRASMPEKSSDADGGEESNEEANDCEHSFPGITAMFYDNKILRELESNEEENDFGDGKNAPGSAGDKNVENDENQPEGGVPSYVTRALAPLGTLGSALHKSLVEEPNTSDRYEEELEEIQNMFNSIGCTSLVVQLITSKQEAVTLESIRFGTALLWNGNKEVQEEMMRVFQTTNAGELFFHEIRARMRKGMVEVEERKEMTRKMFIDSVDEDEEDEDNFTTSPQFAHRESMRLIPGSSSFNLSRERVYADKAAKDMRAMEEMLRLLQLLCEGHNRSLQDMLRQQLDSLQSYDLVTETSSYLEAIERNIDSGSVSTAIQVFDSLTEYCQGPCAENQLALTRTKMTESVNFLMHSSNIRCSRVDRLRLQSAMLTSLLSLLEGSGNNSSVPRHLLATLDLVLIENNIQDIVKDVTKSLTSENTSKATSEIKLSIIPTSDASNKEGEDQSNEKKSDPLLSSSTPSSSRWLPGTIGGKSIFDTSTLPEEVQAQVECGYSYFFLLRTLNDYDQSGRILRILDRFPPDNFFSSAVGSLEIVRSGQLERIYYRIPPVCSHLTTKSKVDLIRNVKRTNQQEKLEDMFERSDHLLSEMEHREALATSQNFLMLSANEERFKNWSFGFSLLINLLIIGFYTSAPPTVVSIDNAQIDASSATTGGDTTMTMVDSKAFSISPWVVLLMFLLAVAQLACSCVTLFVYAVSHIPLRLRKERRIPSWLPLHLLPTESQRLIGRTLYSILSDTYLLYYLAYTVFAILGILGLPKAPYFFAFHLLDIVVRSELLKYVIKSVTANGKAIMLTACLALVIVYIYSIFGFLFFRSKFGPDAGCDNMLMCLVTSINMGLRSGGGIGDVLEPAVWSDPDTFWRILYDSTFFFLIIVIMLNIIFGIIIDTFGELRAQNHEIEEDIKNKCFICGIERETFDRSAEGFDWHIQNDHHLFHYVYFFMYLRRKERTEYTGPEQYVADMIKARDWTFLPALKAMCLGAEAEEEAEKSEQILDGLQALSKSTLTQFEQLKRGITRKQTEMEEKMTVEVQRTDSLAANVNAAMQTYEGRLHSLELKMDRILMLLDVNMQAQAQTQLQVSRLASSTAASTHTAASGAPGVAQDDASQSSATSSATSSSNTAEEPLQKSSDRFLRAPSKMLRRPGESQI